MSKIGSGKIVGMMRSLFFNTALISAICVVIILAAEGLVRLFGLAPPASYIGDPSQVIIKLDNLRDTEAWKGYNKDTPCRSAERRQLDARGQLISPAPVDNGGRLLSSSFRNGVSHLKTFPVVLAPSLAGATDGRRDITIFMFGGSTTAGDGMPCNEHHLPHMLQAHLNELPGPFRYTVYNFGVSAFNHNNESALLGFLLKNGQIPDIALFFDGTNSSHHGTTAGTPVFNYRGHVMGTGGESRTTRLVRSLRWRSALVRAILPDDRRHIFQGTDGRPYEIDAVKSGFFGAEQMASRARATVREMNRTYSHVRRIGKAYGVKTVFVLQPSLFTKKKLAAEETELMRRIGLAIPYFQQGHRLLFNEASKRLPENPDISDTFIDATDCLDDTPRAVFVDHVHASPAGNDAIGKCLAARLGPMTERLLR